MRQQLCYCQNLYACMELMLHKQAFSMAFLGTGLSAAAAVYAPLVSQAPSLVSKGFYPEVVIVGVN